MTAAVSALAAALAAALLAGPRHRPLVRAPARRRRMDPRGAQQWLDGRSAGVAAALLAGVAGMAAGGLLVAAASALASAAGMRAVRSRRAERRSAQRQSLTEAFVDALSAELSSGAGPADAVAAVIRDLPEAVSVELEPVHRALRTGADAAAAWREIRAISHANAVAAVFRVCEDTGASLATVLTRLAALTADERRRRDEIALALAGPRSSAALLATLPALGVLAGAGLGASPLPFLLGTPAGHVCFLLGVGLDVLGAWWVARLAASAGRPPRVP